MTSQTSPQRKKVLILAGHDPTGGAGIQADIETLGGLGVSSMSVITSLTCQDTKNVYAIYPQDPTIFSAQLNTLLEDICFDAVKVGLIGSTQLVHIIATTLKEIRVAAPSLPVIVDPILAAGGGKSLANEELVAAIAAEILPLSTLTTPNLREAQKLTTKQCDQPLDLCRAMISLNCKSVLLTTTDSSDSSIVTHYFYDNSGNSNKFTVERLDGRFHGSGCTLASAITGYMAHGMLPQEAIKKAQSFTMASLRASREHGKGQRLPDRFFWIK